MNKLFKKSSHQINKYIFTPVLQYKLMETPNVSNFVVENEWRIKILRIFSHSG